MCANSEYNVEKTRGGEEVRNMIFHVNERINYWENRRTLFLQISLGIMAFTIASFTAIVLKIFDINSKTRIFDHIESPLREDIIILPVLTGMIISVIGAIVVMIIWTLQNNQKYPFNENNIIWKWHYRGAEKNPADVKLFYSAKKLREEANKYIESEKEYIEKYSNAKEDDHAIQDMKQLYLCLVNEKFKIKMASRLKSVLLWSVYLSIGFSILVFSALIYIRYF